MKDELFNERGNKEVIWFPDRNRTHDLPNTCHGRALYPLSYENSCRARPFNWVHMLQQLYYSLIYLVFICGLSVWGNTCSSSPGPLIILQKRAILTIWTLWAPLQRTRGAVKLNWPSSVSFWPSQWTSYLSV